jgi:hypothetical protein
MRASSKQFKRPYSKISDGKRIMAELKVTIKIIILIGK